MPEARMSIVARQITKEHGIFYGHDSFLLLHFQVGFIPVGANLGFIIRAIAEHAGLYSQSQN